MDDSILLFIIDAVIGIGLGFAIGYYYHRNVSEGKIKSADKQAEDIIAQAEARSRELEVQSKEEAIQLRQEVENEVNRKRQELERQEERLQKRQESLDRRFENMEKRERILNKRQSQIDKRTNELEKLNEQRLAELERVSSLTRDEAKDELIKMVEMEARQDMARVIRQVEADIKQDADRKAREIVTMAIQRIATEQVSETVVSAVPLRLRFQRRYERPDHWPAGTQHPGL